MLRMISNINNTFFLGKLFYLNRFFYVKSKYYKMALSNKSWAYFLQPINYANLLKLIENSKLN